MTKLTNQVEHISVTVWARAKRRSVQSSPRGRDCEKCCFFRTRASWLCVNFSIQSVWQNWQIKWCISQWLCELELNGDQFRVHRWGSQINVKICCKCFQQLHLQQVWLHLNNFNFRTWQVHCYDYYRSWPSNWSGCSISTFVSMDELDQATITVYWNISTRTSSTHTTGSNYFCWTRQTLGMMRAHHIFALYTRFQPCVLCRLCEVFLQFHHQYQYVQQNSWANVNARVRE